MTEVVAWLLEGDVAVQFRTRRDLLGRHDQDLQDRIAVEGVGAALLRGRGPDGHWGRGFYQPKWTSTHYTLLELKNLGLSAAHPAARRAVRLILQADRAPDGGLKATKGEQPSDACVNGMALNYLTYFGGDQQRLAGVVDFLLRQQVPDGGFNCRLNRGGARHSSLHTTVSVIEGITQYERSGYEYRLAALRAARADASDFLLRHRLYRSERTGEVINPAFTLLHHPARWHFDVLRGMEALADSGVMHDERMDDALDLLGSRRGTDGRWVASRPYPGQTHVARAASDADRWVSLVALKVLNAYAAADSRSAQRP